MRSVRFSTSRRSWSWITNTRPRTLLRLNGSLLLGWGLQAAKSESTCLFRLSSVSRKDARTSAGQGEVERSTSTFPGVQWVQRIIWSRWGTNRVRVEHAPRTHYSGNSHKKWIKMATRGTSPEEFEDRPIFVCFYNDIDWTKQEHFKDCFSHSEKVRNYAKRFPAGTLVFSRSRRRSKMVWNAKSQTWRTMVDNSKDSGHPVIQATSACARGFLNYKGGRCTIHFSAEPSNAELLYFAQFTTQISSVSTEQSRIGVEILLSGQTQVIVEKSVAKENEQLCRKLEPEEVNTLVRTLETNVQATRDRLRVYHENFEKWSSEIKGISKFWVCWIHEESLHRTILQNCSWHWCWIWRNDRVMQSKNYLVIIKIPKPKSVQFVKSKITCYLVNMELKYTYRQHHKTDLIPGLSYPEAHTSEMVSSTSVERSHAVESSIEETQSSKPQAQSSIPMIYPSKEFIRIDERKRNGISAYVNVERYSFEWKISMVRHRDLTDKLRREVESEGAQTFSDSQWLGHIFKGSDKPRCQFCVNSNDDLLHVRAIQGHSGG